MAWPRAQLLGWFLIEPKMLLPTFPRIIWRGRDIQAGHRFVFFCWFPAGRGGVAILGPEAQVPPNLGFMSNGPYPSLWHVWRPINLRPKGVPWFRETN